MNKMTEQDKQLLLKDLCARLPYGVKINIYDDYLGTTKDEELNVFHLDSTYSIEYRKLRPYLRPMSSMTKEEKKKMQALYHENTQNVFKDPDEIRAYRFYDISVVDWLNEHHFDYRNLIEKGLAIVAPEDMYKTE